MSANKVRAAFNKSKDTGYEIDLSAIAADAGFIAALDNYVSQVATVTLVDTDIKALNATPFELIEAPVGGVVVVEHIFAESIGAVAAYTGANDLEFRYTDDSGAKVSADLPASLINAADATTVLGSVSGVATALVPVAEAPIVAYVPTDDPGGATAEGTITITVIYRVYPITE
jgi:hypothetical protein